jgi:hypothetical protein
MNSLFDLADVAVDEQDVAAAAGDAETESFDMRATFDPSLPASLTPAVLAYCPVRDLLMLEMTSR